MGICVRANFYFSASKSALLFTRLYFETSVIHAAVSEAQRFSLQDTLSEAFLFQYEETRSTHLFMLAQQRCVY